MAEAHRKVQKLITKVAKRYQSRCGGSWDELLAVANLAFTEAVHTWNPARGRLSTHVWTQVRYALLNEARALAKQCPPATRSPEALRLAPTRPGYRLEELPLELSGMALEALDLLLGMPEGSSLADASQHLMDNGWPPRWALTALSEIQEAIS